MNIKFNPTEELLKQRLLLQNKIINFPCYEGEEYQHKLETLERIIKNMDNIINLDDKRLHKTDSVICLSCLHDWQAVYPENTDINNLECPNCKKYNSIEFNLISARKIIKFLFEQSNIKLDNYVKFTYKLKQELKKL